MKDRIVFFDADSTLVTREGLDSLGERKGKGDEIKKITEAAMNGQIPQEDAMRVKMDVLKPSREDMQFLADEYVQNITPDAREVVQALQESGVNAGIITGNFRPAIEPLAKALGIDKNNIYANDLDFNVDGSFKQVRAGSSLMTSQGKAVKVQELRSEFDHITMVGDGSTDLVTQPYVDRFIGFGGVVRRKPIEEHSRYYIRSESLAPVLRLALPRRMRRKVSDKSLLERANRGDVKKPNFLQRLRR